VAAGEQETAAALLDQSARQPTEHEELAGILVTQVRVAEERFAILHHWAGGNPRTGLHRQSNCTFQQTGEQVEGAAKSANNKLTSTTSSSSLPAGECQWAKEPLDQHPLLLVALESFAINWRHDTIPTQFSLPFVFLLFSILARVIDSPERANGLGATWFPYKVHWQQHDPIREYSFNFGRLMDASWRSCPFALGRMLIIAAPTLNTSVMMMNPWQE
jgi:hypothetical protein